MRRSLVILSAMLAGCAGGPAPEPARPDTAPGVASRGLGLEVTTLVVAGRGAPTPAKPARRRNSPQPPTTIEGTLAALGATPLQSPAAALWEQNGIKVWRIPVAKAAALRAALPPVAPVHVQWLGFGPARLEALRSPAVRSTEVIALDSGLVPLETGGVRLLVRSWVMPGEARAGTHAALARLDVVPQIYRDARAEPTLLPTVQDTSEEASGALMQRLALEETLTGGDALVFTLAGDAPRPPAPTKNDAAATDEPGLPAPVGLVPRRDVGPPAETGLTLGRALLTDDLMAVRKGERVILIIAAHPPREFRLLGDE